MYNVRIKKNARPGDQKDFSLHTGLDAVHSPASGMSAENSVRHTMTSVPREEANIEVEGGETVVGDVNNDGYIEHFEFKGKRHSKGGMPVNIPEGSFIFSDTKKLAIKDRQLLKEVFDKNGKKGGYTPAEISKQYKLNHFMATLRDENADKIAKGTANLMVKKNLKKLGELALVQESIKGFPTGVPAIAELAMGAEVGNVGGEEQMPMMKKGGTVLSKMNGGGTAGQAARNGESSYASKLWGFIDSKVEEQAKKNYQAEQAQRKKEEASKQSSGNPALDKIIQDYRNNPTSQNAKKVMSSIEESYPFDRGLGDFWNWISGTGKYNHSKVTGDSKFIREVYLDAHNKNRRGDTSTITKEESFSFGQNQLKKIEADLENGKDSLLPHQVEKLTQEKSVLENLLSRNDYTNLHNMMVKQGVNPTAIPSAPVVSVDQASKNSVYGLEEVAPKVKGLPAGFDPAKAAAEGDAAFRGQNQPQTRPSQPSAQQAAVNTAKPATGSAPSGRRLIASFEKGGEIEKPLVNVYYDEKKKIYEVEDISTGKIIFNTYTNPGNMTPGGMESSYPDMQPDDFVNWYKGWVKAMGIKPNEIKNNEDFQEKMYGYILENDPESIEKTWSEVGLNRKAMQDRGLLNKLIDADAMNPETGKLDFSKLDPETKKSLFKEMGTYYKDGMVGVRSLNQKAPEQPEVVEEAPAQTEETPVTQEEQKEQERTKGNTSAESVKAELMEQARVKKNGPWYIQDQMNMVAAMTDPIRRYEPVLGQVDLETPDTVFLDPSRQIAASQEQQARMDDMLSNSLDPNVAAAMSIGASGEGFANTANVIAQTENQNVATANQAAANNANTENQEKMFNTQALQKYVGEMATLNQNLDNSLSNRKYRTLATWNNGTTNWHRKKIMEQVLFPQVYQNPITGDIDFSGQGRDPLGVDTYMNPMMGAQNPQAMIDGQLANYESRLNAIRDLRARGYADEDIRLVMGQGSGRTTPAFNDRVNMGNAMMGVMPQTVQLTPDFED
jgi:hypothetical protein